MITKFEKRVIAVILAAVMSLPVTAFSSVTVKAEQADAASGGEVQTSNEALPDADAAAEDFAEGQTPVPDAGGEASDDAAEDAAGMDVPDDGAFIPLEEEKKEVDSADAGSDSQSFPAQETQENSETVRSAKRSAYSDAGREEILLSENGDPVRMITETETANYIFCPEETGAYYLNVVTSSGSLSVFHKTDDGETQMRGVGDSAVYELTAGETYYIDVYGSGVEWDFGQVQDVNPGTYETEISEPGQARYFRLVYGTSDIYWFKKSEVSNTSVSMITADGTSYLYSSVSYRKLDTQKPCYIEVEWDGDRVGTISWSAEEVVPEAVEEGEEITTYNDYAETGILSPTYSFEPETSGRYMFPKWSCSVYDGDWEYMGDGNVELTAGQTYYIRVTGDRVVWKIEKIDTVAVQTGTDYKTVARQPIDYVFSPAEPGIYHFSSEQEGSIKLDGGETQYGFDYWVPLEAGTAYGITVSPDNLQTEVTWSVNKASIKDVTAGTEITSAAGEHVGYRFVPQVSGDYLLNSSDLGSYMVYNSDWTVSDGHPHRYETGFGSCVYMEAGQAYYILIFPSEASAVWTVDAVQTEGDYSYWVQEDGTVEILKYNGTSADIAIPGAIGGKTVSSVGYDAFSGNGSLESVTVPASVTDLQYGVFQSCANLKTVEFAEGSRLQSIGQCAFYWCESLTEITIPEGVESIGDYGFYYSGLTSVVIPDNVTQAGTSVFSYCRSLSEATLGTGLKEIPDSMFYNCSKLQKTNIPSGVTFIGNLAFTSTDIRTAVIPDSVTAMGESVFAGCESLSSVTLGSGMEGIESGMFSECSALTEISLPENITYIADSAFYSSGLTRIDIPDSVTSIGKDAFRACSNLQEANIGNGLAYVAESAFSGCDLTEVVIGSKVEKIEIFGFMNNKNLESVSIPNSVTEIQYSAFEGCESLFDIEIPDSVEAIGRDAFESTAWYDAQADGPVYAGKVFYQYKGQIPAESGTIEIAEGTKGIAARAFFGQTELTGITIPDGVTNIGEHAFTGCRSLTEITIPETVTRIDEYAVGYVSEAGRPAENFTIYGVEGSAAQAYAEQSGFKFVAIEPSYIKGDVDKDGEVNIVDLRIVLRSVCGKAELDSVQILAADVEKDNIVDIRDLRKILRFICDKIEIL